MHNFRLLFAPLAIAAALSLPAHGGEFHDAPSDAELEGDVRSAFARHGRLSKLDIEVDVNAGHVRLSGDVPTSTDADLARHVAAQVEGVSGIDDSALIAVGRRSAGEPAGKAQSRPRRMDFARRVQDMTLQADVRTKLLASDEIDGVGIQVSVNDGVAVLEGRVDSETTRRHAERIAREVRGIEYVDNLLVVGR